MPLKDKGGKRQYDKLRQRRLRGFLGKSLRGGSSHVVPNVVPALRGNVVPRWVSEAPRPFQGKAARAALDYMRYIAERGYTLDRVTGELLDLRLFSQERMGALEEALRASQQRITLLEADMALQVAHETPRVYVDYLEEIGEEP